jgi:hypothetical protein
MKKIYPLFLFFIVTKLHAQNSQTEEKLILQKVNQFFESLEKQDTILLKSIVLLDGQTASIRTQNDSLLVRAATFKDRLKSFVNPQSVIYEKMLSADIKIHGRIAMAWVPYTLSINQNFNHCGIDVFTFFKTGEGWKIVSLDYSVEPSVCPERK